MHWSSYQGNGDSSITGTDGVAPAAHWNNVTAGWDWGGATGLLDDTGWATTAAVTCVSHPDGTHWWVTGPTAGLDNLLVGPWGGDGGYGANAIPNKITNIPYATYDIIAYANPPYAGNHTLWVDSNPTASNPTNAPVAGSQYWFSQTGNTPGFVQMTNNTNNASFPAQNYVVFSGLSGPNQTLWVDGLAGATNQAFTGFQIVDTTSSVPEPASLGILGLGGLLAIRRRKQK